MQQSNMWRRVLVVPALFLALAACSALQSPMYYDDDDDADASRDALLTHHVKAALDEQPDIQGFHIAVDTVDGVVHLIGFVDSAATEAKAVHVAEGVKGVTVVKDNLVVANRGDLYR